MKYKPFKCFSMVVLLLGIVSCSQVKSFFPDKKKDYQLTSEIPALHVPPDLSNHAIQTRPEVRMQRGAEAYQQHVAEAKPTVSKPATNAIAKKTGIYVELIEFSGGATLMILIFRLAASYPPALSIMASLLEKNVSRSGLHQPFSEKAAEFVKCCLQTIIVKQTMKDQPISIKLLDSFNRVIIQDSSSWDVSSQLKKIYTGSGGSASEANCKLQFCYDYKTASIILLEDTKGTQPDQAHGKQIKDVVKENDLILRDLGYSSYETFSDIAKKKHTFVRAFSRHQMFGNS